MTILLVLTALLLAGYAWLLSSYRAGWKAIPPFVVKEGFVPQTSISIIIPARNEEGNIASCIESLLAQDYPAALRQIIVVDDNSVDATADIAGRFINHNVQCIRMANLPKPAGKAYKKQALAAGIAMANSELILTTDADCLAGPQLLRTLAARYEESRTVAIIGPVTFAPAARLVEIFQVLDFATMQGVTAAIHHKGWGTLANGANLSFQKAAFNAVGGYEGTNHIVSGDDLLLVYKLGKAYPGQIAYLKSEAAIVSTPPQPDLGTFLEQRVRWASKSGKYGDGLLTAQLALVYLTNLALLGVFLAAFLTPLPWGAVLVLWGFKAIIDSWSAGPVLDYYGLDSKTQYLFLFQPLHVVYIVVAGFLGMFGKYSWKGRAVK